MRSKQEGAIPPLPKVGGFLAQIRMKLIQLIPAIPLILGCVSRTDILLVDTRFTQHEMSLINSAISEWVEASDSAKTKINLEWHTIDRKIDWIDTTNEIRKIYSYEKEYVTVLNIFKTMYRTTWFRGAEINNSIILVGDFLEDDDEFRSVIMHELGHLYGIEHHIKNNPLMDIGTTADCIDQQLLKEFCNHNTCGENAHPTCED